VSFHAELTVKACPCIEMVVSGGIEFSRREKDIPGLREAMSAEMPSATELPAKESA